MQNVLFFMQYMRGTQAEGGSTSHVKSLAIDWGGKSAGSAGDPIFAPCDCKVVRARTDSSHEIFLESVAPVRRANGTVGITNFVFMHDETIKPNVKVGAVLKQGEYFANEGGFGRGQSGKFAVHCHSEAADGPSQGKQYQNSAGTYVLQNQMHHYDVFFVPADCVVLNDFGYPWQHTTDKILDTSNNAGSGAEPTPTIGGAEQMNVFTITAASKKNVQGFGTPNVDDVVKNNLPDGTYLVYKTQTLTNNDGGNTGITGAQIRLADGSKIWAAVLDGGYTAIAQVDVDVAESLLGWYAAWVGADTADLEKQLAAANANAAAAVAAQNSAEAKAAQAQKALETAKAETNTGLAEIAAIAESIKKAVQ